MTFLVIVSPPVLSPPPPSRGIGARVASAALVRGQSDLSRFVGTEELFFPLRMGSLDGGERGGGAPLTSLTATLAVYKEGILVGGGADVLSALVSAGKERCSERKGKLEARSPHI